MIVDSDILTLAAPSRAYRIDPTRTLTLRNAFVRDMNRRFRIITAMIRKAVIQEDVLGLRPFTQQVNTPGRRAFAFPRSADKVDAFMRWLDQQVEKELLEVRTFQRVGSSVENAWTDIYIYDSYKRGVMRARYELRKAGYAAPTIGESGGIEAILSSPFHVDRVGLLYTRTFSGLKGITATMDTQISRILAQGIADGDNPVLLGRKLIATINGSGMGDLAITDSLGRFVPAQRRAQMLARTEVIRAHHEANMQEYANWGVDEFELIAEFKMVTAGDHRVCSRCEAIARQGPYSFDYARGLVPVHPSCRCVVIPSGKKKVEVEVNE